MRLHCLLLLLLLFFIPLSAFAGGRLGALSGVWTPIKNTKDQYVAEIAEFAVTEHDKQSGAKLKLERVIKGETQVVAGTKYRLVVAAANDGSETEMYEAVVWEKPWQNYRNLTSFKAVEG